MKNISFYLFSIIICLSIIGCKSSQIRSLFAQIDKPTIVSINPKIVGIDFQGVDLDFDLDVNNPYSIPIKSPEMKYSMDIENTEFLKSYSTSEVELPAKGVGTVTLPVRVGYTNLWQTFQSLKDKPEIGYTLNGALVLNNLPEPIEIPVTKEGKFPVLRIPQISAPKIESSDISFGSAKLNMNANLTNPNIFSFKTDELGYSLTFGNIEVGGFKITTPKTIEAGKTEKFDFTADISGVQAISQLLSGELPGKVKLMPTGTLKTPYGDIRIPNNNN